MAGRLLRQPRGGFIMMFTLVAVALAGLVMVETAPDFSNYAVLAKGEEFDRNLSTLRQVVAAHPFCLTTSDQINAAIPAIGATTGVLTSKDLLACLQQFVVPAPGPTNLSASRTVMSTIPRDPYVPTRDWLSNTPQSKFWATAYNCVRNPSFYAGSREEAYLDNAFKVYYMREYPGGSCRIFRTDRFGLRIEQICYQSSSTQMRECVLSPDGSAIAFSSNFFDDPAGIDHYDIFVVGTNSFLPRPVTDHRRLTTPATFRNPVWSADGGRLAFTMEEDGAGRVHLVISQPMKDNPADCFAAGATPMTTGAFAPVLAGIGGIAWAPLSSDEAFIGRSRFLAFTFDIAGAGGEALSLYDFKTKVFVFDRPSGAASPDFRGFTSFPCTYETTPVWRDTEDTLLFNTAAGHTYVLNHPGRYPAAMTNIVDTGIRNVAEMKIVPPDVSLSDTSNWLVFRHDTDNELYRTKISPYTAPPKPAYKLTNGGAMPGWSVSRRGTQIVYAEWGDPTQVNVMNIDGTGVVDIYNAGENVRHCFFSEVEVPWRGPSTTRKEKSYPNVKVVSPAVKDTKQFIDTDAWRVFMQDNVDFPGDFKFASSWLRLQPPENQNQLLFDDGWFIWRVYRDSPNVVATDGTQTFMGKIDPTWSWQGSTYIAKEARDPTGGEPADLFKQAFLAATTLIAGRGYTPDIAPNDQEFCYAQAASALSTYPGDSTTYPIEDLDLWVSNTSGAAEPSPRCITPDSPESYESEPSYSPDGRYIYYTRERQHYSPFLASHEASLCRVTPYGGTNMVIQECGSTSAEWSNGEWGSQMEYYGPSVSPDGTRVAFIGKERLTSPVNLLIDNTGSPSTDNYQMGDIITECVYIKDVLFNAEPVMLLRVINNEGDFHPAPGGATYLPVNDTILRNCSITNVTWAPDGEELFVTISTPMNKKFPKCVNEHPSTSEDDRNFEGPNVGDFQYRYRYYDVADEQIVLGVPVSITHYEDGTNSREFASGNIDPPGFHYAEDNYRLVMANKIGATISSGATADKIPPWPIEPTCTGKIFNTVHSKSAGCFQRVITDSPFFDSDGFSLGIWYILSGYVRTGPSAQSHHNAQLMVQLFNNKGTLVALTPPGQGKIYQVGYPDIGATEWTRFSAALKFDIQAHIHERDMPPYYINLCLYATGDNSTWAEFTGLKLEKAFDNETLRPTRYSPGWVIFSPSLDPDPRNPGFLLFER